MNRRKFLKIAAAAPAALPAATSKPNVLVILADDLGFGTLNCYGSDTNHVRTPNLDRLAKQGIRFTDANTPSSVCSPSRYALLTGRYCWRTSLQYETLNTNAPLHIEPARLNLASLLQSEGYHTAAIGKWHLGYGEGKTDFTQDLKPGRWHLCYSPRAVEVYRRQTGQAEYACRPQDRSLSTTLQPEG